MSKSVNFKFHQNWKRFREWFDVYSNKNKQSPIWVSQQDLIQKLFEASVPNIINWNQLWDDYVAWARGVFSEKGHISWGSQQRQIETLLLNQLKDLNKEQFILVFMNRGVPDIDNNKMSYFDALRVKEDLEGGANGENGNTDLEYISIVNINSLIRLQ